MRLASLWPLESAPALESISLDNVDLDDSSLLPLAAIPSLREAGLGEFPAEEIEKLRKARPDLLVRATSPGRSQPFIAIAGVERPVLSRLVFDTEGGGVGIYADNESDIQAAAALINDLARSISSRAKET